MLQQKCTGKHLSVVHTQLCLQENYKKWETVLLSVPELFCIVTNVDLTLLDLCILVCMIKCMKVCVMLLNSFLFLYCQWKDFILDQLLNVHKAEFHSVQLLIFSCMTDVIIRIMQQEPDSRYLWCVFLLYYNRVT